MNKIPYVPYFCSLIFIYLFLLHPMGCQMLSSSFKLMFKLSKKSILSIYLYQFIYIFYFLSIFTFCYKFIKNVLKLIKLNFNVYLLKNLIKDYYA